MILHGDFESSHASELLERSRKDWCDIIDDPVQLPVPQMPDSLRALKTDDIRLQNISLLFAFLRAAGGSVRQQHIFNNFTPKDNLILYARMFGVRTPAPPQFGTSNLSGLTKALRRSVLVVKGTGDRQIHFPSVSDIEEYILNLSKRLPIAFSNFWVRPQVCVMNTYSRRIKGLPPQVVNQFTFAQERSIEDFALVTIRT